MPSPIDWSLVRQVAHLLAAQPQGAEQQAEGLHEEIEPLAAWSERLVAAYTGLELTAPRPRAEALTRRQWVDANIESMRWLMDPVADGLGRHAGAVGPLAPLLRAGGGIVLAAEVGVVTGYLSQRVLGQYDLNLPRAQGPQRLYFVAPNLLGAIDALAVDRDDFLRWIALHEVTHVFEFQGVEWIRPHMLGLVEELLETVEIQVEEASALRALTDLARDPRKLLDLVLKGDLLTHFATPRQRRVLEQTQSLMAVIEGYSEHVMDAVGAEVIPSYAALREAMDSRRRSRGAPERLLQRLLGLDLKLRQYEDGKAFCDAVVARGGLERLNAVWQGPDRLPSAAEIADPEQWLARTAALTAA